MKLTTLATMSATVEAKTSSIISCATLRLLAPGHPVISTGLYGFQEPVPSTIHCDLTESHATLRLLAPGHPVIHTGLYGFQEPVPSTIHCDLTESHATLRLLAPGHPVIRIWNWIILLPGTSPKHSSL